MTLRVRAAVLIALAGALTAARLTSSAQTPDGSRDASAASVASYALSQQMPVDPEVAVGTLPNGLRYYVRPNGKPRRRAEMRLVVRAGSVLEDDDQRGLAHYVEHMEFEGTRHFPGQSIGEFLSGLGLSIGPDANAATSYDDTQYTLRIPTDVPGVLDRALLVLEDWAQGATFDQGGIDRERGIVLSEWRLHLGAGERTQEKIRHVQLQGSRYEDRPPIGTPESIERAQREQLVRFYRDWYRPDLMAVIVVGDVDRDAVVAMIKQHFSPLASPSPARRRPAFDVPDHNGTRFAIVTDTETTTTAVALSDLRPARNQGSVGGYRDIMKDQLFSDLLGSRLDEVGQSADPPFLKAAVARGLFPTPVTKDEATLDALVANGGVTRGLDALITELQRVVRFGFTATELARAKQATMLSYERSVTESPDRESASRANEYTRNFLQGEALPTIWQELAFHRRFLPDITLNEINALGADWFPTQNRLVIISAPQTENANLPNAAQLTAVVSAATAKTLEPHVDASADVALMETPPRPGTIVKTTVHEDTGITEWTLSNGATVVIKPTTLKQDQILFRATAPGGTSLASDSDFIAARDADSVVAAGGAGTFSEVRLERMLSGKAVAVRPFIDELHQGMAGGSTPQDLETMFQLLYLRFTQPRADPTAFAAMASQARGFLANQTSSPDFVFERTINDTLSGNSARRRPETQATVDAWNLQASLAFYKARFADAGNFTFVFVGSFTPERIKPLVETYIASLPATRAHETWRDLGITRPAGVVEKAIEQGIAPKSRVAIVLSGAFEYDLAHLLALRTSTLLLESRLVETIRQELGETYSITAVPEATKFPRQEYSVRIEWACNPARTAALIQRVFQEIAFVRTTRLSERQMASIRDSLLRDFENDSQDNGYLLRQISRGYLDGDPAEAASVASLPRQIVALTSDALHQAAETYLKADNYVQVTLMPVQK